MPPTPRAPATPPAPASASSADSASVIVATPAADGGGAGGASSRSADSPAVTDAVASVLGQLSQLGPDQIHHYPDSNAWANGPAVAGGGALLGVYPGGQSENPASPWYTNLVPLWWDGKYLPVPEPGSAAGPAVWRLNG